MADLKTLSLEQFEPCLMQQFVVTPKEHKPFHLQLIAVDKRGDFDPDFADRQAFSLIFRGPYEPVLPQQIWSLAHEAFGELDIFLVPIGPDKKGMRYEAVFT